MKCDQKKKKTYLLMETQKIATGFFKNTLSKKHFRIEKFHQSLSYIHLIRNTKNSSKR